MSDTYVEPNNMVYGSSGDSLYDYASTAPTARRRNQIVLTESNSIYRAKDNMFLHSDTDRYDDDGSYYDADIVNCEYWDGTADVPITEQQASVGPTKMLPQIPMKHSNSMFDGMFTSNHHRNEDPSHPHYRFGAALPTTPPQAHKKSRMLPQPVTQGCGYSSNSFGHQCKINRNSNKRYNRYTNERNGSIDYGGACADAAADMFVAASSMDDKCLPTVPLRVVSQPRLKTQPHSLSHNNHDIFTKSRPFDKTFLPDDSSMLYSSTIFAGSDFPKSLNSLTTSNMAASRQKSDIKCEGLSNSDNTSKSTYSETSSLYPLPSYLNMASLQRPHSSMAPLNYASEDQSYEYNSVDRLSTCSEPTNKAATTVSIAAVTQLQQQQRKYSIILAMTTSSVIASGETRFAPIHEVQSHSEGKSLASVPYNRSFLFEYDSTGAAVPKAELCNPLTASDGSFKDTKLMSVSDSDSNSGCYMPATSKATSIVATSTLPFEKTLTYSCSRSTTNRKLPKLLPTLPVVTTAETTTAIENSTNNSSYFSNSILYNNNNYDNNDYYCTSSNQNNSYSSIGSKNSTNKLPNLSQSEFVANADTLLVNVFTIDASTDAITTASTTMATPTCTMSGIYCRENFHGKTTTISTSSPSFYLSHQNASSLSASNKFSSTLIDKLTASATPLESRITEESSMAESASYPNLFTSYYFKYDSVDDTKDKKVATTCCISENLPSIDAISLKTTSTTSTADALAYKDYMKTYSFSTYFDYISNIDTNKELKSFEATSLQSPSTTPTLTSSPLSATTSILALKNIESSIASENNTTLSTYKTPSTFWPSAQVETVSNGYVSFQRQPQKAILSNENLISPVISKVFPLSIETSTSSSAMHISSGVSSVTKSTLSSLSTIPSTTTCTDEGAPMVKFEPHTTSSSYYLNFPLCTTTSTAILTKSATTWLTSIDEFAKNIATVQSYSADPFTTTNSSPNMSTCYSTANTSANIALATPMTTTLASNTEFSYDEYMKQFNIDSFSTNALILDNMTTLTATHTEDSIAKTISTTITDDQKHEQYKGFGFETSCSNELENKSGMATIPTTEPIDVSACSVDATVVNTSIFGVNSSFNLNSYMSVITTDSTQSFTKITTEAMSAAILHPVFNTTSTTAFDDNFYDSFKVDLGALTSSTLAIEKPIVPTQNHEQDTSSCTVTYLGKQSIDTDYSNLFTNKACTAIPTTSEFKVAFNRLESQETLKDAISTRTITSNTVTMSERTTAAAKASSMFGGISKGLKGGLDGVLSGVSIVTDTNKSQTQLQQHHSSTKKGFGFSLASKFVPSVGGLLQNASQFKPQQPTQPLASVSEVIVADCQQYMIPTTSTTLTPVSDWNDQFCSFSSSEVQLDYKTGKIGVLETCNSALNNEKNFISSPVVSSATFYDEDNYEKNQQMNAIIDLKRIKIVDYSTDYKYGYDEYGYSENDYIATGDIMETSTNSFSRSTSSNIYDSIKPGRTSHLTERTAAVATTTTWETSLTTVTPSLATSSSSNSTEMGMASSLFSSLTNAAAAQVQTQQPTRKGSISGNRSGANMFESFLGKAAAAVHSATQAVNQGASMATAVVQNLPSDTTDAEAVGSANTSKSNTHGTVYGQQEPSYTQRTRDGEDDYKNCNISEKTSKTTAIQSQINNRNNNFGSNIYEAHSKQMILSTVLPAGSTGKKLPTINCKSGYLMKQPAEIFDDENDEEDVGSIINEYGADRVPNYRMDSEQDDYYMDHQQTTPLSRDSSQELELAMTTNEYYAHTNGGYAYQEDYFNEEDEFKYLEKEQKVQEALLLQKHTQSLLHQHQKQPPLEYIEESRDDYIDDNYPSEDSGNYLDESSSGSGGGVIGGIGIALNQKHMSDEFSTTTLATAGVPTSMSAASTIHQQIKKQDSIILEEDEEEDELLGVKTTHNAVPISSHFLSGENHLDEDQMLELPQITQKNKKSVLMRGETEEVVGGHIQQMLRKSQATAKQRWHWAYNKIIMQLNNPNCAIYVSTSTKD